MRSLWVELLTQDERFPYVIFNDRTLAAMAKTKPKNRDELLDVKGVGEKKAADLGTIFLEHIAAASA